MSYKQEARLRFVRLSKLKVDDVPGFQGCMWYAGLEEVVKCLFLEF